MQDTANADNNSVPAADGDFDPNVARESIVGVIKTIYDPEIPVNIYDLGLIYDVDVKEDATANITMTLTSPNCPEAETLPPQVEQSCAAVKGMKDVTVHVVWEPAWTPDMMSEEAKLELNMF